MLSKSLLRNTLLLTGVSLLMSLVGMGFQARLARALGSTALGLYQLTLSVSNLCATLAVSGIRFASTRLIAEELGSGNTGSVQSAMLRCLCYAALFGAGACAVS